MAYLVSGAADPLIGPRNAGRLAWELSLPKVGTQLPVAELKGAQMSVQQCEAIPGEAASGLYPRPAECPAVSASLSVSLGSLAGLWCGGGTR